MKKQHVGKQWNTEILDKTQQDRRAIYILKKQGNTLERCYAMCCRSLRSAIRAGLTQKRSHGFVKKWFENDPIREYERMKNPPFFDRKKGRCGKGSKYSNAEKANICKDYKKKNNQQLLSMTQFCKLRASETPNKSPAKSSLSRWLSQNNLELASLSAVPQYLTALERYWAMEYCIANRNRQWEFCSSSDESFFKTGEIGKMLKPKVKYCIEKGQDKTVIPQIQKSKWAGVSVPFWILISPIGEKKIVTFENPEHDPLNTPYNAELEDIKAVAECALQNHKFDFKDKSLTPVLNDAVFVKRNLPSKKRKAYKKKAEDTPEPATFRMTSRNFVEKIVCEIEDWYIELVELIEDNYKENAEEIKKLIWHFHDNARYYTSKLTQDCLKQKEIPAYPPGGYYGFEEGFPPFRPDLNYAVETVIGIVKYYTSLELYKRFKEDIRTVSATQVANELKQVFNEKITLSLLEHLFETQQKIILETIECKGGYGRIARGIRLPKRNKKEQENEECQSQIQIIDAARRVFCTANLMDIDTVCNNNNCSIRGYCICREREEEKDSELDSNMD